MKFTSLTILVAGLALGANSAHANYLTCPTGSIVPADADGEPAAPIAATAKMIASGAGSFNLKLTVPGHFEKNYGTLERVFYRTGGPRDGKDFVRYQFAKKYREPDPRAYVEAPAKSLGSKTFRLSGKAFTEDFGDVDLDLQCEGKL